MVISTLEEQFLQGKNEGMKEGKREGIKEGKKEGIKEGKKEGIKEGKKDGTIQSVLKILDKRFKKIPRSISQSVNSYTDPVALDSLLELAIDCETLAEFERELAH